MSKISYSSLDEVWGAEFNINNDSKNNDSKNNDSKNNNSRNNEGMNNESKYESTNKYNKLTDKSKDDREEIINNMNLVERNPKNNNMELIDYNMYRINTNVKKNDSEKKYTPFQESLEKKYLQDKLIFLENELLKYQKIIESKTKSKEVVERFENGNTQVSSQSSTPNKKSNDIIDLIVIIIIGILIIFVMDSIFKMGKKIGAKKMIE
jgi:hypothetical protein